MKFGLTHKDIEMMVSESMNRFRNRSLLSEISSQAAYDKFYQGVIPYDVYAAVMTGAPQMTPFHKIALDHISSYYRSNNAPKKKPSYLKYIVNFWTKASEEAKQYAVRICNSNADELSEDIVGYIDLIKTLSAMKSFTENSYSDRGFEVLYEDEVISFTCTKGYTSSCKHYGDSHWCTASDQFGNVDGFEMFKRYTVESDGILVQFINKINIQNSFQLAASYYMRRIAFSDICDWSDKSTTFEEAYEVFKRDGVDLRILCEKYLYRNMARLFKETKEIVADETEYYERKKKERIKIIRKNIEQAVLSKECEEFAVKFLGTKRTRTYSTMECPFSFIRNMCYSWSPGVTFVEAYYVGKNNEEKNYISEVTEDDDDYYYRNQDNILKNSIVFVFDRNKNIIGKYIGYLSLLSEKFAFITNRYDDEFMDCKANAVLSSENGKVLFRDVTPISSEGVYDYFSEFEDEFPKLFGGVFDEDITPEEWLVVKDERKMTAYALNYENGDIVQVPYND